MEKAVTYKSFVMEKCAHYKSSVMKNALTLQSFSNEKCAHTHYKALYSDIYGNVCSVFQCPQPIYLLSIFYWLNQNENHSTQDSRVVPHRGTN